VQEIETVLTRQLGHRGLERVPDELAFMHKGQAVVLKADTTIYRGYYIAVLERGHKVREFRSGAGAFDWDAIAYTIVGVVEGRTPPQGVSASVDDLGTASRKPDSAISKMIGAGLSSQLSLEPSLECPGRVRVTMRGLDLDPVAALQLYAAVSRVLLPVH
jgi:hypothetical protein